MKPTLNYTLIGDGSSDKALLNIIKWLLDDLYPTIPTKSEFADFRFLPKPPQKSDIKAQIEFAAYYFPFDLLFYHRDAESNTKEILSERKVEILDNLAHHYQNKVVCIVPIVMMESWLLIDEMAIKKAAGNRNYKGDINLPSIAKIETIKEPKQMLNDLLKQASGLRRRSLKMFNANAAVHLVSEYIGDYSLLRKLSSFREFERDLIFAIDSLLKEG